MQLEGCPPNAHVSLVFCGDTRIRTLNRIWRHKDTPTDVLSFSQIEDEKPRRSRFSKVPTDQPVLLGDVIISVQTAERQAKKNGVTLAEELHFLLLHGILHLLGWDHMNEKQLEKMLARQTEILSHVTHD